MTAEKKKKTPGPKITWKEIKKQKFLLICSAFFVIYGFVFYYLPLGGWIMAFQNYKPKDGFLHSKFVGLDKFRFLFHDATFIKVLRNTLGMGVLNLVTTFIMAILFAILLNEVKSKAAKKSIQTISYLPHFLSWIIVTGILHDALSGTSGGIENCGYSGELFCKTRLFLAHCGICQCMEGNRLECHHLLSCDYFY